MLFLITLLTITLDEVFPFDGLDVFFSVFRELFSETHKLLITSNTKLLF